MSGAEAPALPTLRESMTNQTLAVPEGGLERKLEDSLQVGTLLFLFEGACLNKVKNLVSALIPSQDKAKVVDCNFFLNEAFHSSACC